ncbi:helix-turn-helix domain-containing protein [Ectothiorhodospira marina]|uniref:Helix-turn-helix domain-containing protein n=1 Tax=Ectothiorhodospira marina TaxID=1396821 RepID=A0A1H7RLR9_9GAMM|nr:helix-turn-helix transcriptional regulator [Ectothiorhodospira marina]SEL61102.1 Helix-turn-helix domain-containing protein [Ectothiorhodospira marina]
MNDFKSLFKDSRNSEEHWVARATQQFTEDLYNLMERRGVSKAELARRLETSPAYITKLLRGDVNFTVRSMVRLARALDGRFVPRLEHETQPIRWVDLAANARRWAPHRAANRIEAQRHLALTPEQESGIPDTGKNHDTVAA